MSNNKDGIFFLVGLAVFAATVHQAESSIYAAGSMYMEENMMDNVRDMRMENDEDETKKGGSGDDLKNDPTRRRLLRTNTLPKNQVLPVQVSVRIC